MTIDIVGEDLVTQTIIQRLIKDYRQDFTIGKILPVRGGMIKKQAPLFNKLPSKTFLLTDLDSTYCPPTLLKEWLNNEALSANYLFRIAQEEAETWLMADVDGFSSWLGIDKILIPSPKNLDKKKKEIVEITFPLKPSLYLMQKIVPHSSKEELKQMLLPVKGASKGPAYNSALIPFIEKKWNPENGAKNSYSLFKAIERLKHF